LAEAEDGGFGLRVDLAGAGARTSGAGLESIVAALAEGGDELIDPESAVWPPMR